MVESLKIIKNRIRSIQNIEKVTSAMQMISATKLNRLGNVLSLTQPYFQRLESLLNDVSRARGAVLGPFFEARPVREKITLCVVTSDNGLCGAYNNNVIHLAERFISDCKNTRVSLVIIGKRGYNYFKKFYKDNILHTYLGLNGKFSQEVSDEITKRLISIFLSKDADEIYIAYTHFKNALVNKPLIGRFLNIEQSSGEEIEYIFEPDRLKVLEELVPKYLAMKIKFILLDAFTCEHSSRLMSMRMANENAKDLLHELILLRNKVRQANITRDIIEIISSAEALKG